MIVELDMFPVVIGHEFPDYVFQEWPKWVTRPDGESQVVRDPAEEKAFRAAGKSRK